MHNIPHTEESKLKMSLAKKGKHYSRATEFKKGSRARWKGGKRIGKSGYIYIHSPKHPKRHKNNYYPEHRIVMEKHLGRHLDIKEVVHHVDGNKKNNKLSNLVLFENNTDHMKHHHAKEI